MRMLDWNPAWETGIPKIDEQHRELFRQIEILMVAIHENEMTSCIPALMPILATYVGSHFSDEEAAMEASGYPELVAHRAVHDGMREKVRTLLLQFQSDPTVMTDAVLDFLMDWLINHINGEDRRMALYLARWNSKHPQANA